MLKAKYYRHSVGQTKPISCVTNKGLVKNASPRVKALKHSISESGMEDDSFM